MPSHLRWHLDGAQSRRRSVGRRLPGGGGGGVVQAECLELLPGGEKARDWTAVPPARHRV